jgi:hypothetical protein
MMLILLYFVVFVSSLDGGDPDNGSQLESNSSWNEAMGLE